ncbi:hypothetical protein H4Q26_015159 [Puccinia striiformis f. sp. tritici PST-130]|nr:hypothetical protein H4Q26_015159 [Puccinia striiformis f. sp. tritici PST-130]
MNPNHQAQLYQSRLSAATIYNGSQHQSHPSHSHTQNERTGHNSHSTTNHNLQIYSHLASQSSHTSNQQLHRLGHSSAPQSHTPSNTNLRQHPAHSSHAQPTTNCQSDGPFGPVISGCGSVQTRLASVVPQDSLPGSSSHTGQNTGRPSNVKNTSTTKQGDNMLRPNIRQINCILKNLAKDRQPAIAQPSAQSAPPGEEETLPNEGESGVAGDNEGIETKDVPTSLHRGTGCNENDILPAEDQNGEGENGGDIDDEGDTRIDEVPGDVLEEISGMDLDELREYESLHAENKRLPAYLKAELDDMYYEFERQLHIFAIRFQLHVALLYMHIGLVNKMRGATNYNNFCRLIRRPARFLLSEEPLKQRCKDVAKVWATIDPEIKSKYKDPAYIETIRGDVPMLVVNGCIQTARKTHVANTSLNLACNQKSTTFVRRWAHDTIQHERALFLPPHSGILIDSAKLNDESLSDSFCFEIQDDAGGKTFSGWPGKNAAHDLGKANIQVKVKKNTDNFVAKEIFQPIKAINIETSRRILQAIGEGWIHIKYQEDSERASSPVDNITNQAEPAAKKLSPPEVYWLLTMEHVSSFGILRMNQFMKLSLVQPGVPFDVLLNHDSKRKTQAVVSVRGDDKLIGDDAAAMAARYPQNSYPGLKLLLGQPIDSPAFSLHQSLYNIPAESTTRGTIKLMPQLPPKGNTTITYLPEELVALQFSYARELADIASANNPNAGVGGEKITDCIITVPGFFNQFERKALLDGAELAGLKVLNLIDDGASFGVNYAMMRTFGNKKLTSKSDDGPGIETHLIYDFGASSIKATVIEFSMFEEKIHVSSKIKKNVTMVDIKGYGHQRNLGGLVFDRKIRDILKQDFLTQTKIDVTKNDRAMTKLLREATRVKQVLSANAESQSRIEGLVDEHDFKSSLTRQAFEDACAKEIPQFTQPILDALEHAKMSMADIKSVILVGGSSRVPMVQAAVKSLVGEDRIAVNVNADEAAVMGAALYGAGISRQFKTKDVRIQNVSPHAVSASYNVTKPTSQADPTSAEVLATKTVTTTLFQIGSKLGAKKVIKMKKAEDFSVQLNYINQPSYFPSSLLNVTIHGISAALLNYTNATGHVVPLKNTTVKLVVGLDDSELLVVPEATLIFPTETSSTNEGTIANKIAGFFGGSNKEEAEEAIEEVATEDDSSKTESKEKSNSKAGQSEVEKAKEALKAENAGATDTASKKQQGENMTIKLTITRQNLGIQPMSTTDRIASGKFLRELKAAETRKRNREEARNALEAYTYKLRDRLEQEVFQSHSTEQETNELKSARDEVSDWLNDWAEQAPLKELKEKKQKLERLENPIQKRMIEQKIGQQY